VAVKKREANWRWIEGVILLLLILATILVGEGLYEDAVANQLQAASQSSSKRNIPAVLAPSVNPFFSEETAEAQGFKRASRRSAESFARQTP
jgi:hypothetical protein